MEVLYGLHPVEEALKAGRRRFDHVLVARERHDARLERLVAQCRAGRRPHPSGAPRAVDPHRPDRRSSGCSRTASDPRNSSPSKTSSPRPRRPTPGPARRACFSPSTASRTRRTSARCSASPTAPASTASSSPNAVPPRFQPAAVKASAGAAEHLRIARVVNLVRALEELKAPESSGSSVSTSAPPTDYDRFDFTGNCVLVLGREGAGLHDLVRRTCDHLLRIPMAGGVSSLNVSTAGAVVLYEAFRQRRDAQALSRAPAASKQEKQKGLGS